MINERPATVAVGPAIRLEAQVATPADARRGIVLCHPHPLYGGDMDNPVVVRAAEVCREANLATLRFNFRGVGGSTGSHDEGRGEQDDLQRALDHLAGLLASGSTLAALGYSFGAAVAARVAMRRPLAGVALIAPALAMPALADLGDLASVKGHLLIVAGTADTYCPIDALQRLARAVPHATVRTVEGADHFFFGKLFPLGEIVGAWARQVAGGPAT
jgi:alpha/beta superfamily hydrolase